MKPYLFYNLSHIPIRELLALPLKASRYCFRCTKKASRSSRAQLYLITAPVPTRGAQHHARPARAHGNLAPTSSRQFSTTYYVNKFNFSSVYNKIQYLKMRLVVFFCVSVCVVVGQDLNDMVNMPKYDQRYDYLDVDAIFTNKRLVRNYVDCLINAQRCTPEGKALKSKWYTYIINVLTEKYCRVNMYFFRRNKTYSVIAV